MRIPGPSLPGTATVSQQGPSGGAAPGPVERHSRLQSAAPPPPEGPPFGRCSCSELASPNSLERRGKTLTRRLKTRERRGAAGAAKTSAAPRGLPLSRDGAAKSDLSSRTDTNRLSNCSRPTPRSPAPSLLKSRPVSLRVFAQVREY